jgi:hypothetical protein
MTTPAFVGHYDRHCERSEAIQSRVSKMWERRSRQRDEHLTRGFWIASLRSQ